MTKQNQTEAIAKFLGVDMQSEQWYLSGQPLGNIAYDEVYYPNPAAPNRRANCEERFFYRLA